MLLNWIVFLTWMMKVVRDYVFKVTYYSTIDSPCVKLLGIVDNFGLPCS